MPISRTSWWQRVKWNKWSPPRAAWKEVMSGGVAVGAALPLLHILVIMALNRIRTSSACPSARFEFVPRVRKFTSVA